LVRELNLHFQLFRRLQPELESPFSIRLRSRRDLLLLVTEWGRRDLVLSHITLLPILNILPNTLRKTTGKILSKRK
jgi:hypothetical protein